MYLLFVSTCKKMGFVEEVFFWGGAVALHEEVFGIGNCGFFSVPPHIVL
jgi:hypothetical protein